AGDRAERTGRPASRSVFHPAFSFRARGKERRLDDHTPTSSEQAAGPGAGTPAPGNREGTVEMDPYTETTSESPVAGEAGAVEAMESDSAGTVGSVENAPGFDEARVVTAALPFAQEVTITKDLEALPDAGTLEF